MSFLILATYWNNHHHMFHTVDRVNGKILWANMHLLFWLSLVPFVTDWIGESHFATLPAAVYGVDMFCAAVAFAILANTIVSYQGPHSKLAAALGGDAKGKLSTLLYALAIPLAFVHRAIAYSIYAFVALLWLVPDRRIESRFRE
jgi:uncharacterized membrane protein